uniref:C2H2-type domain-containing protein n=1 Tax=Plectus sambesii TaxID=2011161 RepID=A0A914X3Y6_9BILA
MGFAVDGRGAQGRPLLGRFVAESTTTRWTSRSLRSPTSNRPSDRLQRRRPPRPDTGGHVIPPTDRRARNRDDAAAVPVSDGATATSCTCQACKQPCADIWSLMKHVYVAHGLRICQEDLPGGAGVSEEGSSGLLTTIGQSVTSPRVRNHGKQNSKSFSLDSFCSERLKEMAEKAGSTPAPDASGVGSLLSPRSAVDKTPSEANGSLRSPGGELSSPVTTGVKSPRTRSKTRAEVSDTPKRSGSALNADIKPDHDDDQATARSSPVLNGIPTVQNSIQNMWMQPSMLAAMQEYYTKMSLTNISTNAAAAALFAMGTTSTPAVTVSTPALTAAQSAMSPEDPLQRPSSAVVHRSKSSPSDERPTKLPRLSMPIGKPSSTVRADVESPDEGDLCEP